MDYKGLDIAKSDTICALATANGSAAIAVIRISGENSHQLINQVFYPKDKNWKIEKAVRRRHPQLY